MLTRQPILSKSAIKALLALTKTRCQAADHALRPPTSPGKIYQLNTMLLSAERLKSLLPKDLRYVIVDGVASAQYQPARFTEDIDLMVLSEASATAEKALRRAGWTQLGVISFGGSSWQSPQGELIDLLHAPDETWVSAALATPSKTPEGLESLTYPTCSSSNSPPPAPSISAIL